MIEVRSIQFKDIQPIWKEKLWPNRKSPIKPVSTIKYLGGYDMDINSSTPTFLGAFHDDNLIGVLSGFKTSSTHYRCRGLFVDVSFRKMGVAQNLFTACQRQAHHEKAQFLWSLPRQEALQSYLLFGFEKTSDWQTEGLEFGPNCYVIKKLDED